MEAEKLNKDEVRTSPFEAGFFYRRIGGTLYKVRVFTSDRSEETLPDKVFRIICNETMTGGTKCGILELPQMSQPPEGSSA
jgi:hypothetical protein